jgi:hypothetical protein
MPILEKRSGFGVAFALLNVQTGCFFLKISALWFASHEMLLSPEFWGRRTGIIISASPILTPYS